MNIGDIVKHKNMPDRLRIRSISECVCTLEFIDRPKIYYHQGLMDYKRCIARIENLFIQSATFDDKQLSLFA